MAKLVMVKDGHLGGYVNGGDPGTWCPHLWTWVVQNFGIRSVLDVGCGEGHSTRFFHNLGCEVLGIDGCRQAIEDSVIPDMVVQHDFCDGAFIPDRRFDLIWSCEFLEHVHAKYLANILDTFAYAAKFIMVTHAFPGQDDGHHHVNCRPSSYWIRHIESLGFRLNVPSSRQARIETLRDYYGVNHFARSGMVFQRIDSSSHNLNAAGSQNLFVHASAAVRSVMLSTSFRWSAPFRSHMKSRRAMKRMSRWRK